MSAPRDRVLLVEDEEAHAELVARAFERVSGGYQLHVAESVRAARDLLLSDEARPDLVFADLNLPDGSGTDLLGLDERVPVIVITSHGDEGAAVEAMKAGALDYIVKSQEMFVDLPHVAERSLREWRLRAERDRSEDERRRADERLRMALSSAPISATTQDRHLRITWVHDPQASREPSDILGKTDYDLLPHHSAERIATIKRRVIETGKATREEVLVVSEEQTSVYDLSVFPHADETGNVTEITCVSVDVTERRRLEEALAERERLASVGMAASILAHEIGNPLNNMFLSAQMLERKARKLQADEGLTQGLSTILSEIRRLNNLLGEFRSLSRRERLDLKRTDVGALLGLVLDTTLVAASRVRVQRDLPEDLQIHADPDKLTQVFVNLCTNAVEAMPEGGTLTIRAGWEGDRLVVEIGDTGRGIPADVNVFEPFQTTKPRGTGLGLPVVRQIVTAHAGTITYESTPGQGTIFRVALPTGSAAPSGAGSSGL